MKQHLLLASEFTSAFPKIRAELLGADTKDRLLYIPTAALGEGWIPDYEGHVKPFEELGYEVTEFDLKDKTPLEVKIALNQADVIYVSGGNTFYLLTICAGAVSSTKSRERSPAG